MLAALPRVGLGEEELRLVSPEGVLDFVRAGTDGLTPSTVPSDARPLVIDVRTTTDPFDVHIWGSYEGARVALDPIQTPGSELEYPGTPVLGLPVGTPVAV